MKAFTWQRALTLGTMAGALAASLVAASANAPSPSAVALPDGLPALPSLTQTMQSDMRTGMGLRGFDPVAYRVDGRAVAGQAKHELLHEGIVWRFASAANLAAFSDAPEAYLPAFAGFDPTGVVAGAAIETDPRQFAIVGSRLLLFSSAESRSKFLKNAALLDRAEAAWPALRHTMAR